MDNRKNNKGTKGNKGGRKSKAEEQQLIERLSPLEDIAFEALETALHNEKAQSWAVPLYFNYKYGKPQVRVDVTSGGDKLSLSPIQWLDNDETTSEI